MSLRRRLVVFVEKKMEELDKELSGELREDTSLLKSGVFDSLALLQLAEWIEREVGPGVDLRTFDLSEEWDTIGDIVNFIERHRRSNGR